MFWASVCLLLSLLPAALNMDPEEEEEEEEDYMDTTGNVLEALFPF